MLSEKCFVVFYIFSFPPGVYVGTENLIASIPGPSILTLLLLARLHVIHQLFAVYTEILEKSIKPHT